jgi:hypothetical protein
MSNFQINDIIRCYIPIADNINIIFIETLGNGLIKDIQNNNVTICWDMDNNINHPEICDLNNFMPNGKQNVFPVKKIADNDWIDKDGNRYNDAGVKQ